MKKLMLLVLLSFFVGSRPCVVNKKVGDAPFIDCGCLDFTGGYSLKDFEEDNKE